MEPSERNKPSASGTGMFDALGRASVIGLHMVSGIIVGAGLGYGLDRWLDTFPWCSGVGLIFGIAAGFRNVWMDTKYLIRQEEKGNKHGEKRS